MTNQRHLFDRLLKETHEQLFAGWDFSDLNGRWHKEPLPWDYRQLLL